MEQQLDQATLLEKFDVESRFRKISRKTISGKLIFIICIALSLFHLYTAWNGPLVTLMHRAVHTSVVMLLVFLLYPANGKSDKTKPTIIDIILGIASIAIGLYIIFNYKAIVLRAGLPNTTDIVFAVLTVFLVLEGGRRIAGNAIVILAIVFMGYAIAGPNLPDIIAHRGYEIKDIVDYMYLTTEGIFGIAIGVSSTYIFLFVLFGAFLGKSGMGAFFNDLAMAIAGHGKGGPAKVAVVSSGLLGSINGSAVANVVTTGAFTIPLMKKIGYDAEFAGAVEAAASCGGQILPPVMGATAFIMAEYLGMPYIKIAAAAVIPALLYYLGVITVIHLRASKTGLEGLPKSELPKVLDVLKSRGHLLIPLVGLLYLLIKGYTPIYSAFFSILLTIGASAIRKETRMSFMDIIDALEEGARTALGVAMACATVGIIIGVATLTGFGLKLAGAILFIGKGNLFATLFLTMIACIVLGMGLPSIPAYIITATMAAPALAKMGVPLLVSHMFVFYFGMLANLTPPVALAAFAGAGISGGNATKTGIQAVKIALAGFVVPYIFAYAPTLLLIDANPAEISFALVTAIFGVVALGVFSEGYIFRLASIPVRLLSFACAISLMMPGLTTDLIGIVLFTLILANQKYRGPKVATVVQ